MGATIPPESQSQLASSRDETNPHESVTIAPPTPNIDELLSYAMPVPAHSHGGDQYVRAGADAGSRAGSSLTELSNLVSELSRGLSGARQANERLAHELSTLRAMLGSANEQQLSLTHRAAQLEEELRLSQSAAERERQLLARQQDDFLTAILEEHDNEGVRASEALARAQTERDEAQALAEKRERERDELRAEASRLRAHLGTHRSTSSIPPPVTSSRPPSFRPPMMLQLDAGELDSTLHTRSPSPRPPSVLPQWATPPAELHLGLNPRNTVSTAEAFPRETTRPGVGPKPTEPPPPPSFGPPPSGWTPPPPAPDSSQTPRPVVISAASLPPGLPPPALKQKPDPTTRPLIDYSLGGDGVSSETLEGARISSKPPRK
jgi:hypothetical protein